MANEWMMCRDGELPDGPACPNCGGHREPSGVDGGTWVHVRPPNDTLRLQLEADAGAVPGCTTECAKIREENTKLRAQLAEARRPAPCSVCGGKPLASGRPCICGDGNRSEWDEMHGLRVRCFELEDSLASLRADAEAVRAVEDRDVRTLRQFAKELHDVHAGGTFMRDEAGWMADKLDRIIGRLTSTGSLMARRQEGKDNNG